MASGQYLRTFGALDNEPPASNPAIPVKRNSHWGLSFDASTNQSAVFADVLPSNYAGGGLTMTLHWGANGATSGNVIWNVAVERVGATQDQDSDGFSSVQTSTVAVPGTDGLLKTTAIAFTSGAQMDSLVAGERYRVKVTRDAANGSDTAAAPAELYNLVIAET